MALNSYGEIAKDTVGFSKNISINLAVRYGAAFGMMAAGKALDKVLISKKEGGKSDFKLLPLVDAGFDYAKFEVPGLEPLEFKAMLHGARGSIFAPPLLMSFSQEKSLVETEVNDSDTIVVERWGTKPWDITINGILVDVENRIYPSDELRRLNQNWQYNGVVKVVGKQFEEKDIYHVYFRSISFTAVEGFADTIQFSINASSMKEVGFTLLKPTKNKSIARVGELELLSFSQ